MSDSGSNGNSSTLPVPKKQQEMVGPYVLGRTLGRGTTGKVKAATHKDTGLEVAVKIVKKQYVRTHKKKVAREIAVMRLLDHPNVLKLYDVLETSQHVFLVMERVKGGELFDYILQKGRLPRKEALRIFAQIVQGMEFCHRHSICHRDIKPENLLLDENLNIKIADFGMAQLSPNGTLLETFCGSPHYGAPEVVSGIKYDGRRSDVWSMGVVFYALVTGMLPFDNPNVSTLLKMVKRGVYHIPKFVPDDIADLIRRMLTPDVEQRIRTNQIKSHRCFLGVHGTNVYFPVHDQESPALEHMEKFPITCREDIDETIVKDLEGLGWGSGDELIERLLLKRDNSMSNLETVFYHMIAARNDQRVNEQRYYSMPEEPASPVSPVYRASSPTPMTPKRGSVVSVSSPVSSPSSGPMKSSSHDSKEHDVHMGTMEKEPTEEDIKIAPEDEATVHSGPTEMTVEDTSTHVQTTVTPATGSEDGKRKKKPLSISITPKNPSQSQRSVKEYSTTPRFHRLKLISSQENMDSPASPITPTAKRSWFKNLFRRRPSVDIVVNKNYKSQGASGMYSEKSPEEIRQEVQRVLNILNVSSKIGSTSDYELKCEAVCFIDANHTLVICDKQTGKDLVARMDEKQADGKHAFVLASPTSPASPASPVSPSASIPNNGSMTPRTASSKAIKTDPSKAQLIKFSVDISRETNDGVSCVNFNHRSGDHLVYRGLYTEIIKHIVL